MAEEPPQESTPPTIPDELELIESRPKWPTVIGWLSVVLGSLSLMCLGPLFVAEPFFTNRILEFAAKAENISAPPTIEFGVVQMMVVLLGVVLQIPLIIAGITAVLRKPVSRPLHLLYAVLYIVTISVQSALGIIQQQKMVNDPEMAQWIAEHPGSGLADGLSQSSSTQGIIRLVFFLAWPVFCLLWFIPPGRSERALRHDEEEELV